MAQKREKEETELKVPETTLLCTAPATVPTSRTPATSDPSPDPSIRVRTSPPSSPDPVRPGPHQPRNFDSNRRVVNRCAGCRRKVGLTGFRCRCGDLFCTEHRYSDRHVCSYDYKAAGREAIARENPVVRPAKILKV